MKKRWLALAMALVMGASTAVTALAQTAEAGSGSGSASVDLEDGLIGYYTFDGTLRNSAGTGRAALHGGAGETWNTAATGTAAYAEGVNGKAYEFIGNAGKKTTETLTGTEWWTGSQTGQNDILSGDGTITLTVSCKEDVSDYAAFSVELVDSNSDYITTGSDGNAWYAGNAAGNTILGLLSPQESVITAGTTYTITVTRSGNDFTVTYYDENSDTVFVQFAAANTNLGTNVSVHVIAQVGRFEIVHTDENDVVSGEGLELNVDMPAEYTISYWVKPDTVSSATSMVFVPYGDNSGLNIADNWFGSTFPTVRIWGNEVTNTQTNNEYASYMDYWTSTADALCGQWTYITVTGDSSGNNVLYINGVSADTGSSVPGALAGKDIFLGINWWDASFDGLMDDVVIYNKALSAAAVSALYANNGVPENTPAGLTDHLTGYYTFDGTLANTAGTGSAILHGGAGDTWNAAATGSASYAAGKNGQAYSFTGDTASRGEGLKLDVGTEDAFSIGMWVNTSQKQNYQPLFLIIGNSESNYITAGTYYNDFASGGIVNYNSVWYWLDRNNNSSSTLTDIPLNTWVYVTLTMTGDGVATLYYNGEILSRQTISGYETGHYADMSIYLGINWWNASYAGLMDDVTVYDEALTDAEVATLYRSSGNPVLAAQSEAAGNLAETTTHVSVHDPSIIKDPDTGMYYVFGSHMAWAKSSDLKNWETFTNNINSDYETIFASEFAWAALGDSVYDPAGNLWAPDVIWNEEMGKWCMYMSINGCSWNSSIVLLTADSLEGNWTRVGTVVYSGMSSGSYVHDLARTDYTLVTGETTLNSRYLTTPYYCKDNNTYTTLTDWNYRYGTHAIDPCVLYDDDGNLWMSYGSWSGGISMIRLNNSTGLRDYSVTYPYESGVSDPYNGYKLAGGSGVSGEASYIQKIGNYYYLYVSYGGFLANGGYNMRIFRSNKINGPYADLSGNDARYPDSSRAGTINGSVGIRLMSYYKWSYMEYGYCAQGHNSCFVDEDGKAYVIYHTRFNDGTETHQMRVHQLFTTENGWLVAAPFEYTGETLTGNLSNTDVAGTYEVLIHGSTDYANLECVEGISLTLNANGTITGDKTGSWAWSSAKGAPYATLTLDGVSYTGVFIEQQKESSDFTKTMTFTLIGSDELCVWGYKQ